MTEVPDYLLQRSRERRAALGLSTGAEGDAGSSAAPVPAASAAPAAAAAATPARQAAPEIDKVEPPKPVAPWVKAAQERRKIPVWMAPVALFLPIWGFMIWGTLEEPTREAAGPIAAGSEVYSACAACHGAGGGGGVGYQLNEGEVLLTFPDVASHVAWVVNGSPSAGTAYGDAARPGGQRISGALNSAMPGFASLSSTEILEVVLYERSAHGLASEAALEPFILWVESGQLPEWETGVVPQQIQTDFQAFLDSNAEAAAAWEETQAAAGGE